MDLLTKYALVLGMHLAYSGEHSLRISGESINLTVNYRYPLVYNRYA